MSSNLLISLGIYCNHIQASTNQISHFIPNRNDHNLLSHSPIGRILIIYFFHYYNDKLNISEQLNMYTCAGIYVKYECKFFNDNIEKFFKDQKLVNKSLSPLVRA